MSNARSGCQRTSLLIIGLLLILIGLRCSVYANDGRGFYIGAGVGYGSTDWSFLVTQDRDGTTDVSAPIGAKDGGADLSALVGYRFSTHFALEGSYDAFKQSTVIFDEYNAYNHYFPGKLKKDSNGNYYFQSKTNAWTAQAKFILPEKAPGLKGLSFYSTLGLEVTQRDDVLSDKSRVGGVFGAGLMYDFTDHLEGEFYFNYYTGYGKSDITPAVDYMPFIYQVNAALLYKI